jgi:hypothetical protein
MRIAFAFLLLAVATGLSGCGHSAAGNSEPAWGFSLRGENAVVERLEAFGSRPVGEIQASGIEVVVAWDRADLEPFLRKQGFFCFPEAACKLAAPGGITLVDRLDQDRVKLTVFRPSVGTSETEDLTDLVRGARLHAVVILSASEVVLTDPDRRISERMKASLSGYGRRDFEVPLRYTSFMRAFGPGGLSVADGEGMPYDPAADAYPETPYVTVSLFGPVP